MTNRRGPTADQIILGVAAQKCGVCTRRELRNAGVAARTIARRVESGFLDTVGRGTYVVPPLASTHTPHHAALAATPKGVLSLHTAAALLKFPTARRSLHLTVPKGTDNVVRGFEVHETRRWLDSEIVTVLGMRCTSPARTLCDLAAHISESELRHVTQTQLVKRSPTVEQLLGCLDLLDSPQIPGVVTMRELLTELLDDEPYPESELERRLAEAFAARTNLEIQRQFRPPWYSGDRGVVDFAHTPSRTIIEADGRRWHSTTQAQQADAQRDLIAAQNGWLVLRIGWEAVVHRVDQTMADIERVLAARRDQPPQSAAA